MPLVINPIATNGYDLISAATATNALAAGNFAPSAAASLQLPLAITAASREIARYCNRPFVAASYTEIVIPEGARQDRGEPASAKLTYFPVLAIDRCATGRATVLLVENTDRSTNQEAWVQLASSGDPELDNWTPSGLSLSRTASGGVVPSTIAWPTTSPYTTISGLAASINALGGGWQATLQATSTSPGAGLLPATYLVGAREPKSAFGPGVALDAFAEPASGYDVDRASGILRLYWDSSWGAGSGWGWSGGVAGDPFDASWDGSGGAGGGARGWPQLQVSYQAGFATVPADIQQVCCELVRSIFDRLKTSAALQGETQVDASWTAKSAIWALPDWALQILNMYKDWRV